MTILFCGGGTLGPVTPLLAVIRRMKEMRPELNIAWAGTPDGPERRLVESEGIMFYPIPVAKLARYFTLDWLRWPGNYLRARKAAQEILTKTKPSLVVSAGGFTSVPVIQEASRRNIPCAIHQLDAVPGLSNRIVAKRCQSVTTSFAYDKSPFGSVKTEQVATPCRFSMQNLSTHAAARPTIFVVGGGTGAQALNEAIRAILDDLLEEADVIHATGKGKASDIKKEGYDSREFLSEEGMFHAYSIADLVISRAGMGGLSELACLKKAAILVPIPKSHQEKNAERMPYPVVRQDATLHEQLLLETTELLHDPEARRDLEELANTAIPTDDGSALAKRWMNFIPT